MDVRYKGYDTISEHIKNSKYTRYCNLKQLLSIKEKIKKSKSIDKNNKIR